MPSLAVASQSWSRSGGARGRLLAMRTAAGAFDGPFNLRSTVFAAFMRERRAVRTALDATRAVLLDSLHQAVPQEPERARRRQLLRLKRDVFAQRPLSETPAGVSTVLRERLDDYARLLERQTTLFDAYRPRIIADYRARLDRLLEDPRFQQACRYSSPGLWEDLAHNRPAEAHELTSLDRTIGAYAAKFVSKANPFYLFAEVSLPRTAPPAPGVEHEIVLDLASVFELERALLPQVTDHARIWIALRPFVREGDSYRFWISSPPGLRVVSLKDDGTIGQLVSVLRGRPAATRSELEGAVPGERIDALIDQEILSAYLVTDFETFAPALGGISTEGEREIATLQRYHLARTNAEELREAEAALGARRYYVNAYRLDDTAAHERVAEAVTSDLTDLKSCFSLEHNFSQYEYVVQHFIADYLRDRGGRAAFFDVLRQFLQDRQGIIARYRLSAHCPPDEYRARADWWQMLSAQCGELTREQLMGLSAFPRRLAAERSLCFNGSFDYVTRTLYLSTVLAGDGRFAGRYFRRRTARPVAAPRQDADVLDVELAPPPQPNLNYLFPAFAIGCGFEPRYAHRYARWVDPAEIAIELTDEGRVTYRHAPSGMRVRMHYRGFLLARYLPIEYQLLLADHADFFFNPFEGAELTGDGRPLWHYPALTYRSICLRRERWHVKTSELGDVMRHTDIVRFAAALRDWVHDRLRGDTDAWYYGAWHADSRRRKPRLLDLLNPLSADLFRRLLTGLGSDDVILFTMMQPPVDHLWRRDGAPYVSELMIEV
jgi:hypothetical protein